MAFQFPIASGKKKPVQVFECPEETWKQRASYQRKVCGHCDASLPRAGDAPELSLRQEIRKEFDETFESVKDFAHSSLKGKEKKQHEAKKIEALGGKAAKNRSMPYNIMMGIKKKAVVRDQKQDELSKQSDVVNGKRKRTSKAKDERKNKKIDFGVQATKGRFKNGVLDVRNL